MKDRDTAPVVNGIDIRFSPFAFIAALPARPAGGREKKEVLTQSRRDRQDNKI